MSPLIWELTVANDHNFTVHASTTDVLVHNQWKCKDISEMDQDFQDALRGIDGGDPRPNVRDPQRFANDGRDGTTRLPDVDRNGNPVTYTEHTVNSRQPNTPLDGRRIVTGSDGSAWLTADHYYNWTKVR